MGITKRLVPGPITRRYLNVKRRLGQLEASVRHLDTAVDALLVNREYRPGEDVGFNGQHRRKEMFGELIATLGVDAIVETGTWLGDTTAYMAETSGKPVHSCELVPRFHAIAKMRLEHVQDVHLYLGDSRAFLQELSSGGLVEQRVLFYLDAHWYADLPLPEEVEQIAGHWDRYAVMIDDFRVPEDPGYGFGQYDDGTTLERDLLANVISKYNLTVYFPSAPSAQETGKKRGCVVLAPVGELSRSLLHVASLRQLA